MRSLVQATNCCSQLREGWCAGDRPPGGGAAAAGALTGVLLGGGLGGLGGGSTGGGWDSGERNGGGERTAGGDCVRAAPGGGSAGGGDSRSGVWVASAGGGEVGRACAWVVGLAGLAGVGPALSLLAAASGVGQGVSGLERGCVFGWGASRTARRGQGCVSADQAVCSSSAADCAVRRAVAHQASAAARVCGLGVAPDCRTQPAQQHRESQCGHRSSDSKLSRHSLSRPAEWGVLGRNQVPEGRHRPIQQPRSTATSLWDSPGRARRPTEGETRVGCVESFWLSGRAPQSSEPHQHC